MIDGLWLASTKLAGYNVFLSVQDRNEPAWPFSPIVSNTALIKQHLQICFMQQNIGVKNTQKTKWNSGTHPFNEPSLDKNEKEEKRKDLQDVHSMTVNSKVCISASP